MKQLEEYLEKHPKKKLIFDLDETILELILPWQIWYDDLKRIIGSKDPDLVKTFEDGTLSTHEAMNTFVKRYGSEAKKLLNEMSKDFEKKHLKSTRKNHDLIELIKKMKGRYTMYVWSSNTADVVRTVLEEVGLSHHFEKIVSQLEVDFIKPDPHGFTFIHDGETKIEEYLFIGDSKSDEGVAKSLGMDFFKVSF